MQYVTFEDKATVLTFCLSLPLSTPVVSSDPNITVSASDAIRGSTAEMVCSFKELGQEIVVKWEREVEGQDRVIAAYNFLERTSQYSFGDDRYTLTYRPTAKLSYATLEISSVSLDDIGNYKCELFGHITDSESLRLEVLGKYKGSHECSHVDSSFHIYSSSVNDIFVSLQ